MFAQSIWVFTTLVVFFSLSGLGRAATLPPSSGEAPEFAALDGASGAFAAMSSSESVKIWVKPGSSPCRQEDGSNPCWDTSEIFDRARDAGQTTDEVIARLLSDYRAEDYEVGEICDGDVISNSGARDGRPFFIRREKAGFDREWLAKNDLEYRVLPDGRTCIPSRSYGSWHFVHACGNAVQVLERHVPSAKRRRGRVSPLLTSGSDPMEHIASSLGSYIPPAMVAGLGGGFGGGSTLAQGGGGRHFPDRGTPGDDTPGGGRHDDATGGDPEFPRYLPYPPRPLTPIGVPGTAAGPSPATVVPLPGAIWMMLGGMSALLFGRAGFRRSAAGARAPRG